MYVIAMYHPPPGHDVLASLPEAYSLSREELLKISQMLTACPVTHEHAGIHGAVESLKNASGQADLNIKNIVGALNDSNNYEAKSLGRIIDSFEDRHGAFWCTMFVDVEDKPGLEWMLTSKEVNSVSLTHVESDRGAIPLEVSIVRVPARPHCNIVLTTNCALQTAAYKAKIISGEIQPYLKMDTSPDQIKGTKMSCKEAMEKIIGMNPELGTVIAARLQEMQTYIESSKEANAQMKQKEEKLQKALDDAEKALKAKTDASKVDITLLKSQLEQLHKTMVPAAKVNCGMENFDSLQKELTSENPQEILGATLKTIMCCNQTMMMNSLLGKINTDELVDSKVEDAQPEKKVKAEESAAKKLVTNMSQQELLARALTNTFEPVNM